MAELEFDDSPQSRPRWEPGTLQGYVNLAGAVTSLILVVGVGIWGYKLTVRDVGGVPVIKALKGPMRIAPEDPGGRVAQNEGLAVNAVAADEPLPPDPSRVVLAPPPLALSPSDTAPDKDAPAKPAEAAAATQSDDPIADALNEARNAAGPETSDLAVAASPRPMLRPAGLVLAKADTATPAAPQITVVDPATLKPGMRLVQLGAFPSAETARAEWMTLLGRFDGLLDEKGMVIQKAESGGRSFYRLRAVGFDGEADARAFCAALAAQNAACIPVTIR